MYTTCSTLLDYCSIVYIAAAEVSSYDNRRLLIILATVEG
jgi:hypothetical protein